MKNFEDSLRTLSTPDPDMETFRSALRADLGLEKERQRARRWRAACIASCAAVLLLTGALLRGTPEAGPAVSRSDDGDFVQAYYQSLGQDVSIHSLDAERVVTIREFTLSNGEQMVVYTDSDEGDSPRTRSLLPDRPDFLTASSTGTF